MRTIVDIPEELLKPLDILCEKEDMSRAEAIRQAVGKLLAEQNATRKKVTIDDVFGLWKDRADIGDGLEYQLKLRAEWDERDREIDRRLGIFPPKDDK